MEGPQGEGRHGWGGEHVGAHSGLAFVAPNGLVAPASRGDSSSSGVQRRLQAKQLPVSSESGLRLGLWMEKSSLGRVAPLSVRGARADPRATCVFTRVCTCM